MISEEEIKSKIEYVNEFKDNVVRSMGIRIKITQNRIKAIRILEQNHQDQDGIKLLKRCIKNERWFLRIIEKGLEKSFGELNGTYHWIRKNIKDKEMKNKSKRLIKIVEIFISKINDIDKRLKLEEKFIETQDEDSFKEFVRQWDREIKLNRKLLKKIVDASDLEDYFKKMKIMAPKLLKAVIAGGALGAVTRVVFFTPEFIDKVTGQPFSEEKQILLSIAVFAFMGATVSTMVMLETIEREIEEINIEELDKAKRNI